MGPSQFPIGSSRGNRPNTLLASVFVQIRSYAPVNIHRNDYVGVFVAILKLKGIGVLCSSLRHDFPTLRRIAVQGVSVNHYGWVENGLEPMTNN
jgi:hypothetical protein